MNAGDLVRFKTYDTQEEWQVGLLLRLDRFLSVGEVMINDFIYYAPLRLIIKVS